MLLALDIETKSKTNEKEDALNPFKSEITCIGVYGDNGKISTVYRAPFETFRKEIIENDSYNFVAHNGKFDFKHLALNLGIDIQKDRWVDDTRYMAYVSTTKIDPDWLEVYEQQRQELNKTRKNPHREAREHSLKTLAPYFLGVEAFWEPDESHDNDEYVLKDCEYTYNLHMYFERLLKEQGQYDFYKNKLMPWARMILTAEIHGIACDKDAIEKLQKEYTSRIVELKKQVESQWKEHYQAYYELKLNELEVEYNNTAASALAKKPEQDGNKVIAKYSALLEKAKIRAASSGDLVLNLNSPTQLKWLLKDRLNLDVTNLKGTESADKEVLNKLAVENKEVAILLELKKLTKLTTAFLPKYLDLMHGPENEIHCDFNIDGTRTGRLSSSKPNLQQHPSDLKYLFRARNKGFKLITYDVTAIEPLLMAYYTEDEALTALIQNGQSLHSVNAIIMFNLECEEKAVKDLFPKERQIAKKIGLAVLYSAGWKQVQLSCQKEGIFFNEAQCKEIVNRIRNTYKGVWGFKKALDAEMERGTIIQNLMGRPIQIKDPDDVYMKAFNTLIQGSASDLVLDIGREIYDKTNAIPLLFVHDSIISIADNSETTIDEDIKKIFERELTNSKTTFKLSVDGGISDVWE